MEIMDDCKWENQGPYNGEIDLLTLGIIPLLDELPGNYDAYNPDC